MRRTWIFLILLLSIFGFGALFAAQQLTRAADVPTTNPSSKPIKPWEFRGFALQLRLHGTRDYPFEKKIDEIKRSGANTLCLVLHGYQQDVRATKIAVDYKSTPSDKRVLEIIRYAKKQKLTVMVMPIVLLRVREADDWRGTIKPPSWAEWWKSYRKFILHYSRIAQRGGAGRRFFLSGQSWCLRKSSWPSGSS